MSESPFVPFYTSDFLAGTSGMTAATKGVYITLVCLMYESEAPLPQSWETLARRCGCTKSSFKKAIEALVDDSKIEVTDAGLWSRKCDKHIAQRRERSDSAKAAAKKRWQKSQQKQGKADATASSAQCKPEPEPYKEKGDTNVSPKSVGLPFSAFWNVWPNKKSKPAAEKAWKKLNPVDRQAASDKCAEWFSAWQSNHPTASPILPATFLNNRRWEDEAFVRRATHSPPPKQDYADDFRRRFTEQQTAREGYGGASPAEPFRLIAGGAG